jgi:hypothetical protein
VYSRFTYVASDHQQEEMVAEASEYEQDDIRYDDNME